MHVKTILVAGILAVFGLAQDVDDSDVPNQCRAVCSSVVSLTSSCDQQTDDDNAYINCVCQASGANTQIPECEACVAQFDSDGRDNDVNDLVRSCSFTTTSYNPSAASASATVTSGSASLPTPSASNAQTTGSAQGSASAQSSRTSDDRATSTGGPAEQSTNAAPAPTMGMAGLGLGALGFAMGML